MLMNFKKITNKNKVDKAMINLNTVPQTDAKLILVFLWKCTHYIIVSRHFSV